MITRFGEGKEKIMKNKLKLNAAITTAAVLICVVLINLVLGVIQSKKPLKIDLTRERVYEFSEQTKELMSNLGSDVEVYALIPEDVSNDYVNMIREYLSKYKALSDKFTVTYIDPYSDPSFVKKYETAGEAVNMGSVIVTCGDKYKVISFDSMYSQNSYTNSVSIDMEKKLTSALLNVTGSGRTVKVYFTQGHDEFSCTNLKAQFEDEGYVCGDINLMTDEIPSDTSIIVIAAPSREFESAEIDKLDNYSDAGGQMMIVAEQGKDIPSVLASYMADWGITVNNDYIVENDSSHIIKSAYGAISTSILEESDITNSLISQKLSFVAPASRSITAKENNVYHTTIIPLLKSSEKSFARNDLSNMSSSKIDGDTDGPLTVSLMAEKYNEENTSRMFVLGSLYSVEMDGILTSSSYANGDFILNAASYMTDNAGSLDIRAKQITPDTLNISQTGATLVTILILFVLPIIIIGIGIFVWWRRRYL